MELTQLIKSERRLTKVGQQQTYLYNQLSHLNVLQLLSINTYNNIVKNQPLILHFLCLPATFTLSASLYCRISTVGSAKSQMI